MSARSMQFRVGVTPVTQREHPEKFVFSFKKKMPNVLQTPHSPAECGYRIAASVFEILLFAAAVG